MEPQTPNDVQRILDRKRKRAEYDKQRKLKRKFDSELLTGIFRRTCYVITAETGSALRNTGT
jgi:hypothetical protein